MSVSMVPTVGVVVVRDGNRVRPTIGKAFPFTTEERDAILEAHPSALRKPNNEDTGEESVTEATVSSAEKSQAKARGGKKTATASKSDEEAAEDADL
jgi:hypothetical protein